MATIDVYVDWDHNVEIVENEMRFGLNYVVYCHTCGRASRFMSEAAALVAAHEHRRLHFHGGSIIFRIYSGWSFELGGGLVCYPLR